MTRHSRIARTLWAPVWIVVVACLNPPTVRAQSAVVGKRSPEGAISFQVFEDFLINSSKRIRLLPERQGAVDPNTVKRLGRTELTQAGIIQGDAGRLVHLSDDGTTREIVLPENFALKSAAKISDVPGRLTLTLVRSKKAKDTEALAPESFFMYVNAASPDERTLEFVVRDKAFHNVKEQLAAMEGFVRSFPGTRGVEDFRLWLNRKLSAATLAFEQGGTYKDLVFVRQFADLAIQVFPKDDPLRQLHASIAERMTFITVRTHLLRSLAALGDWDVFLENYADFERYQWSFPDIMMLRTDALEESARTHSRRARAFALRKDHAAAIREISVTLVRDPRNSDARKFFDAENVVASQIEARRNAPNRKDLAKGSPQEVLFQRALFNANKAIDDKNYDRAQQEINDATRQNSEAPDILLLRAKLLAARDRLSEAIPLLDQYDRLVIDPVERDKGNATRNEILYALDKKKDAAKQEIVALLKGGQYSKLDPVVTAALNLDRFDADFLFHGGTVAAVLRQRDRAKQRLADFLERSNSLDGDPKRRDVARRVLTALAGVSKPEPENGTPNWFSGRKLPPSIFYCPESAAFQAPIESVTNSKVHMAFSWEQGRLASIQTTFDDEKAERAYRLMVSTANPTGPPGGPASDSLGVFSFDYLPGRNVVSAVRTRRLPGKPQELFSFRIDHDDKTRARLLDDQGYPQVALLSHPFIDPQIIGLLEGPVSIVVSGNSYFNPFLWDGIHYFSVQYDKFGRMDTAREWNADNLVRLTWDGDRLSQIQAFRANSALAYYQRRINYSGAMVIEEEYAAGGHNGRIKYTYSGGKLQQARVEDNGVHDGKTWTVRFRQ